MTTGLLKYVAPEVPAGLSGWTGPGVSFTISNANVDSDLSDAAVLITFTDNAYFYSAKADGTDFRFVDAADNVLTHQRLSFSKGVNVATGKFLVVVDVDHDADTVIRGFCGNSGASDTSTTNVWDSNYKGAWLLSETGTGSAGDYQDLTANNNDSVNTSSQPSATSGPISTVGAESFNGSTYIQIANGVTVGGTGFTIEGLFKTASWSNDKNFIARRQPDSIQLSTMSSGELRASLWLSSSETAFDTTGAGLSADTWYYLALTYDGTNVTWRVYSASGLEHEQSFSETRSIDSNTSYTWFAHNSWSAVECTLAFWRISNTARAEDLIKFTAAQLLVSGSQVTVADITATWEAVTSEEITGELVLACDAETAADALWAEIEDPEQTNYILNASGEYVDRYTLADAAAWRACLVPLWATSLADDTVTLRRVGQLPSGAVKLPWRARVFEGETPDPDDTPVGYIDGQTHAEATALNPSYERDLT